MLVEIVGYRAVDSRVAWRLDCRCWPRRTTGLVYAQAHVPFLGQLLFAPQKVSTGPSCASGAFRPLAEVVDLPSGYIVEWGGQFELQQEANRRLAIVVPITLGLVFLLLFMNFGSLRLAADHAQHPLGAGRWRSGAVALWPQTSPYPPRWASSPCSASRWRTAWCSSPISIGSWPKGSRWTRQAFRERACAYDRC